MAVLTTEQAVQRRVALLLDSLTTAGSLNALSPIPARVVSLYPGSFVSWDAGCIGQLTVQIVSMSPVLGRAAGGIRMPCSVLYWNVVLDIKIFRCIAVVSNQGVPPSTANITKDGNQLLGDMATLLRALTSFEWVSSIGDWIPVGPAGQMAGGSWTFTVQIDAVPC
jgi:hypothetical protein